MSKQRETNGKMKPFLSQAEMSERRAKGLCYYCDEKFTPDHYLKHKKTQLYAMECEEEDIFHEALDYEEEEEQYEAKDQARISINVISGITDYTTMKVRGYHGKKTIYVLIDSRSTHNFIDPKIAEILGKIKEAGKTKVAVADGNRITVSGKIENLQWEFQGQQFTSDFMVIPLGGHDMVLGVQWLAKLGPITWDFEKLEMRFKWGNHKVLLTGIQPGSVREVKFKRKHKSQESEMQLHMIYAYEECDEAAVNLNVLGVNTTQGHMDERIEKLTREYADIF